MQSEPTKAEPTKAEPPKRKRRWFQFSLRTLVIGVTLFCVWLGITVNRANRQRRAVETIRSHGGHVWYDDESDENGLGTIGYASSPESLRNLIGIDYLATVRSLDFGPADDTAAVLEELPQLRNVQLVGAGVTDAALIHLKSLTKLRKLSLEYTAVSPAGWEPLEHLTNLKELLLCGEANVTDSALSHFEGLTRLECLWLNGCGKITDAGMQHVKNLTDLEFVDIRGTSVTVAGAEDLKRAPPKLTVCGP